MSAVPCSLSDGPVILSNVAVVIETAANILHDIEHPEVSEKVWDRVTRAQALLSIAHMTCEVSVEGIESGPDYKLGGES